MLQNVISCVGVAFASLLTAAANPEADAIVADPNHQAGSAQLGVQPQWHRIPGNSGEHLRVQWSRSASLLLTPNESCFPKLGLTCDGEGIAPSIVSLNGKQSFRAIAGWNVGESATWGIWLKKSGAATVRVAMASGEAIGKFRIRIESKTYELKPSKVTKNKPIQIVQFGHTFKRPGQHLIRIENTEQPSDTYRLNWLEITGEATEGAGVIRTRWRPAAAHAKFTSTHLETGSRMWIMEMDACPGELGFYAPVTTPFGYYGPTWNSDGTVGKSMNFSLWSYGRGKEEPPVKNLSHLLAIGNPKAIFSGFGHEGTGVKIRNFDALLGRQGQKQAFALRMQPGKEYDTYFSYFYATDERRWRLYGVGRKMARKRPIAHLIPGSFVEVPGAPKKQRTGPIPRRMRYRGWISADGKNWHLLDRMSNGNIDKQTGLSHTRRGSKDGWFYLQTGGWASVKPVAGAITLDKPADLLPEYLSPERVKDVMSVPSSVRVTRATREGQNISIDYTIANAGDQASVTLYMGPTEGLTLKKKWAHQIQINSAKEGGNTIIHQLKEKLPADKPVYIRLLLKNEHGQFFTWETTIIQ